MSVEKGVSWYRSKEVFPQEMKDAGYLSNKKWPLKEASLEINKEKI